MGIFSRHFVFRQLGRMNRFVIVRVVGIFVSRMLMAMAFRNLVRVIHLDGRISARHVNKRDGDE